MGKFIVIEGPDGSGKTTQVEMLTRAYEKLGLKVSFIHFPQEDSDVGKLIYKLLNEKNPVIHHNKNLFQPLYVLDQQLAQAKIKQMLNECDVLICDRYLYSTLAYYGVDGNDLGYIRSLQQELITPDATVIFHLEPSVQMERLEGKAKDGYEYKEFQRQVGLMYSYVAGYMASEGHNIIMADAGGARADVAGYVFNSLSPVIESIRKEV